MKIVIAFEVPDDQAERYLDVSTRVMESFNQRRTELEACGAGTEYPRHWSFDLAMRPVAVLAVSAEDELAQGFAQALHTLADRMT